MKLDCVVQIMGHPWRVKICTKESEPRLEEITGLADWTSHFIGISDPDDHEDCDLDNPKEFVKKIARHEIVHAFLFESGLAEEWKHPEFGHEEMIIDWLAFKLPEIWDVVRAVENYIDKEAEI